ncbi:hydroxyethylthiazole kinase [Corynebacterium terpenotabidum]|uniref:Hydroxyethylthiazole kinase n=1 Tax=Corynebacterium terpenotabidum Y-11 TaxID=1200352 RepID=S4XJF6_9CORY|nr:hydroxyethylthiazole kinase [Corynebacterium terpenotabidum]AGP30713.1 hydroxyethylthiazole kinase [Corynebacterium terpenotabidum Y-11]
MSARLDQLRSTTPLVQCLTNTVVTQFTANVLLAAGASPAMVDTPDEAGDFATVASGVLVNLGTPTAAMYQAMRAAVNGATATGTPWVLDPVACGGPATRSAVAAELALRHPTAIRGNPSEIRALAALVAGSPEDNVPGSGGATGGRGVDSTDAVESAEPAALALARATGAVIAVSGPRDLIISVPDSVPDSLPQVTWLTSGDPLMQRVVGTGCSLGALTAAYLGAENAGPAGHTPAAPDRHAAVVAAHAHAGAAGILAARTASAPGSFAVAWLDALDALTTDHLAELVGVNDH